jgi:ATP-dependent RNA helicase DeaD
MIESDFTPLVGPALASALAQRGYSRLTPVQIAVLDAKLAGRDLRITSQTGSGKTVAVGLALRDLAASSSPARGGVGRPRAIFIVPTRELAKQVEEELSWLYAPMKVRVVSATGGASARDERRAFASGPTVIVGTPGRLLDHLERGSIDAAEVGAIVIDEADRMLDLGFREDLEAILAHAPKDHRTLLVSATFPRDVRALADRVQTQPAHVEGTPLGTANADIDHVVHLVAPRERVAAIVNLLLAAPGAQTLIFARTRADVAELAAKLGEAGFAVRALSGEMDQPERNKALAAFKKGTLHALVATDVAARGLDVQDIAGVIHAEPPTDADSYTHRSGRTGRAGRKGTSSVLVSPAGMAKTSHLLRRAGIRYVMRPIPTADEIRAAMDDRLYAALTEESESDLQPDSRNWSLAKRLVATGNPTRALALLLARTRSAAPAEPREIHSLELTPDAARPREHRDAARPHARGDAARPHAHGDATRPHTRGDAARPHARGDAARTRPHSDPPRAPSAGARPARDPVEGVNPWVTFRVSWGQEQGADARRLLAMVCRRGGIRGSDVGAIQVERGHSTVDVASAAAEAFGAAAREPDPRDPRVVIRPVSEAGAKPARDETPPMAPVERRPPIHVVRRPRDAKRPASGDHSPSRAASPSHRGSGGPARERPTRHR